MACWVQVYEAKADDFKSMAVLSETEGGGGAGGGGAPGSSVSVARLQGLPYRVTEEEIVRGRREDVIVGVRGRERWCWLSRLHSWVS